LISAREAASKAYEFCPGSYTYLAMLAISHVLKLLEDVENES